MEQIRKNAENLKLFEMRRARQQIYSEMDNLRTGLMKLDADPAYEQLLKNKSIAVVGPARTMLGKRQGKLIDTYDIVVRFNDAFEFLPVSSALADDIGTRADILYCNQVILRKNVLEQRGPSHETLIRICEEVEIKYFVCTNNSLSFDRTGMATPSCDLQDKRVIFDFKEFLSRNRVRTRFRLVHAASEMLLRWLKGNWGRTGFIAILDLLGFDLGRIYVTGMTFYHGGGHILSPDSGELHPLKNRDGTWARSRSGLGHNSYLELEIMKMLVQCFRPKLQVDEDLSKLFEA